MKLYVKIIAISEEDGMKATKVDLVEIPAKVVRLNEVVMGKDPEAILDGFATSALVGALQTIQLGGGNNQAQGILTGETGGPIGAKHSAQEGGAKDPLANALGLDLIEAMDAKDARQRPQPGPGPIGFGRDRQR